MTQCLQQAGALERGAVRATRIERFAEGVGLLGQLLRVRLDYSADAPDTVPTTLVVKLASTSPQNVGLCEAIKLYWREHQFYTRSVHETPLHTPRMYYSALDGLAKLVLVLQDVQGGTPGNQIQGATPEQVLCAVRHVAQHHAKFWNRGRSENQAWVPALNDPTIAPVVQHITSLGAPHLVANLPECFNDTRRAVVEELVPKMVLLADSICAGITTFVHGDFRIDNLLFGDPGSPELTVVDWQICWDACPAYDVAYLMTQSVEPEVRRIIERQVLRTYHDALVANGVSDYSLEQCFEDYRKAATYCICYPLIAAGTLDLSNARGRALGTMMLNRALSAADDLNALGVLRAL